MPDILVRRLDPSVVKKLKARARQHHRSLQAEVKQILEQAAASAALDIPGCVREVRAMYRGRVFSDSATLIRRDRRR